LPFAEPGFRGWRCSRGTSLRIGRLSLAITTSPPARARLTSSEKRAFASAMLTWVG